MKSRLMDRLIELLNFPVLPIYKLAIRDRIQFDPDPALPPIPHEVEEVWIERVTANNLLRDRTYQGGWRLVLTLNNLHAVGRAFGFALFHPRIHLRQRSVTSPCSKFRSGNMYHLLQLYVVPRRRQPPNASHRLDELNTGARAVFHKRTRNLHLQPVPSTPDHL
uniref:Uncharacterized protein n=1 Tax=Romanomermis culicivorax TaxID=13658 RepID=A0A915LEJ3_ROMCU